MKKPNPWIAAALCLLDGPIGFLYAGHTAKFVSIWILQLALVLISALAIATGRLEPAGLLSIVVVLVGFRLILPIWAFVVAKQKKEFDRRWWMRWYGIVLTLAILMIINQSFMMFVKNHILDFYYVPGRAMSTTINHADRIAVDKLFCSAKNIKRGDLIVFSVPPSGTLFVMRVIGLPGDVVELDANLLRINGDVIEEHYASYRETPYEVPVLAPTSVPERHFFVLGDNRNYANDSRFLGPIPFEAFVGRPTNIYWSREYDVVEADRRMPQFVVGPMAWSRIGRNITQ